MVCDLRHELLPRHHLALLVLLAHAAGPHKPPTQAEQVQAKPFEAYELVASRSPSALGTHADAPPGVAAGLEQLPLALDQHVLHTLHTRDHRLSLQARPRRLAWESYLQQPELAWEVQLGQPLPLGRQVSQQADGAPRRHEARALADDLVPLHL